MLGSINLINLPIYKYIAFLAVNISLDLSIGNDI